MSTNDWEEWIENHSEYWCEIGENEGRYVIPEKALRARLKQGQEAVAWLCRREYESGNGSEWIERNKEVVEANRHHAPPGVFTATPLYATPTPDRVPIEAKDLEGVIEAWRTGTDTKGAIKKIARALAAHTEAKGE